MIARFLRAWLATGITDALFSSVLNVVFYRSTVTRLWQGVAAVLLGSTAADGGLRTATIGLLMHFGVAFAWSAVFLALFESVAWIRRITASTSGLLAVAAIYGPVIWMVMSFVVVPQFTHRPPPITFRWWVQFFGHIPFVALPIVALIRVARPLLLK